MIVLFDLPVKSKDDRRRYQRFHKFLVKDGYLMMQLSVYTRLTKGLEGTEKHLGRLKANLPPRGSVRVMSVTERQYASMQVLVGRPTPQEKAVDAQLSLWL